MHKRQVELNDKELYLLWHLSAWFRPLSTFSLSEKLWPGDEVASKMREKYETEIDRIFADKGSWLKTHLAKLEHVAAPERSDG